MKSLLLAVTLTLAAAPAFAEKPEKGFCEDYYTLAETIMRHRQYKDDIMEAMSKTKNETHKKLVIAAYEQIRYSTAQYQERAVKTFSNGIFIGCLKAFGRALHR